MLVVENPDESEPQRPAATTDRSRVVSLSIETGISSSRGGEPSCHCLSNAAIDSRISPDSTAFLKQCRRVLINTPEALLGDCRDNESVKSRVATAAVKQWHIAEGRGRRASSSSLQPNTSCLEKSSSFSGFPTSL